MTDTDPAELICAVCLYVRPHPEASEDDLADTRLLTVKSGVLVCARHIGGVHDDGLTLHGAIRSAVSMESGGEFDSLSAYQSWRSQQDAEATE